jgi:hypothetical protein
MVLVYTEKITNRIKYIFNLFLKELLNIDFRLTTSKDEFKSFEDVKFSYAKKPVENELFFGCSNLLFERGISNLDLLFIEYDQLPAFLPIHSKESVMPFDPFAAGFYLVSRYEEYLPYRKDEYGRFSANESLAYQKNFLHKPLVNIWALAIGKKINERFPTFGIPGTKYQFIPTIDIDAAWAFKQKGLLRTTGGYLNAFSQFHFSSIMHRTRVLAGLQKDPFDTYNFQFELQKKYKLQPIYFILFAEYGFNDKNIPIENRDFQTLIKFLADYAEVGIHPSFNSNNSSRKLKDEIERLSKVLKREVTKSRQHFLKLQLPYTYRNLINLDITDDYTMGFAVQPGFRASICSSFYFYDLDMDAETKLRVHPFTLMDGTLRDYMNIEADQAMQFIAPLIHEVKAVNGTFISLWHNESLSNEGRWKGWHSVYEDLIREALPK